MKEFTRRSLLRSAAVATGASLVPLLTTWNLVARAALQNKPDLTFPTIPRERLAVATWPFRVEIESASNQDRNKSQPGINLKDFAAKVRQRFQVPGVEPLSAHFPSTDARYLDSFREAIEKAGVRVVDIPVSNANSFYDADPAARTKAVEHAKRWVDVAVVLGSPSIRTSIEQAKNAKPNVELTAQTLRPLVDYGASKNILINLENDDLVSEDAFFVAKVIDTVDHPYLHALPDFCNSMMSGDADLNYRAVSAMFHRAYNICHVKDSEVGDDGKVFRVDLKKTFDILKASNYRGYCSMEWEGPEDPYWGTEKLIAASLENL
jgi:sugar phosphate isomerase/epimerase